MQKSEMTPDFFNCRSLGCLPAHLGIKILFVGDGALTAKLEVAAHLLAPNGYPHAGSIVTLADTAAG
jgi:acyl-coenzyme A thioesterase PaaI-like protein